MALPSAAATLATITALAGAATVIGRECRTRQTPLPKSRKPSEVRNKRKQQKESRRKNRR